MAYRKLGRDNKHRRSMLATLTKQVVMNEAITTTDTRAKEVRKFVDKMITYGKKGDLVSRRKALAFLHNDTEVVEKIFNDLAKRYENRNRRDGRRLRARTAGKRRVGSVAGGQGTFGYFSRRRKGAESGTCKNSARRQPRGSGA